MERKTPRTNPRLEKRQRDGKKVVYLGEHTVRGTEPSDELQENIVILGPFGRAGAFFGFDENTYILYFLIDPADRPSFAEKVREQPVFFHNRLPMSMRFQSGGTIGMFWKAAITKKLAGAVQYFVRDGVLTITHMAVKPAWRKQGLNKLMLDCILSMESDSRPEQPIEDVVFDDPTPDGEKFVAKYTPRVDSSTARRPKTTLGVRRNPK